MAISLSSNRETPSPPAPSTCDNNNTKSLSSNIIEGTNLDEITTIKDKYSAPNRIVNWNQLKDVVDKNLGPCNICRSNQRYLIEQKSACFAVTIAIHCPGCVAKTKRNYNKVQYKAAKLKGVRITSAKDKKEYRRLKLALNHSKRQLKKKNLPIFLHQ